MMIFRDWSVWCIAKFMKMLQLNRRYPSGTVKRRKKEANIKADEKCNGLLDSFVVVPNGTS